MPIHHNPVRLQIGCPPEVELRLRWPPGGRLVLRLCVQPVQDTMCYRGNDDAGGNKEHHARKKGIEGCKDLSRGSMKRIDWSHAAKDHRRIEKGVKPREPLREVVTQNADAEGGDDDERGSNGVGGQAPHEKTPGQEGLSAMFVV